MLLFNSLIQDAINNRQDTSRLGNQSFSHSNLLEELLLALVGFSGDVFIKLGTAGTSNRHASGLARIITDPAECNLVLSPDLSWVDAPDRAVINEIVKLGYHYSVIRAFIQHERASSIATSSLGSLAGAAQGIDSYGRGSSYQSPQGGSIYRQALAAGLTEALDVYQAAVLAIQNQLMTAAQSPVLAALHHQLHDYKVMLPQLHRLLYYIAHGINPSSQATIVVSSPAEQPSPLGGAAILALLTDLSRSGLPALQSTLQRLLWHCYQALHKQLASWMLYGQLVDPYHEFFIRPSPAAAPLMTGAHSSHQQQHSSNSQQASTSAFDWVNCCEVLLDKLPPCISADTAESLAFIGKGVLLLRNPGGEFRGRQLLPQQDTLRAAQVLQELAANPTFDRMAFECCVAALRSKVAALLWQLVVQQAGLMQYLAAFKDYYLLAKGEFAHAFLVEARGLLALPPQPHTVDADISPPWAEAAAKSSAEADPLFPAFTLKWAPSGPDVRASLPPHAQTPNSVHMPGYDTNWDGLYLEVAVDWPLGLLFTPHIMSRYNALFQLLLRMRRIQLALEASWGTLCDICKEERIRGLSRGSDPLLSKLLELRHNMAHVITNMQIYIQVDVIESNFDQLEQRIGAAQDFTEVERAHANYLHNMLNQCFLTTQTMSRVTTGIFRLVGELCRLVESVNQNKLCNSSPASMPAAAVAERQAERAHAAKAAQEIATAYKQSSSELITLLHSSRLVDANRAPYLRQLLMRLNFNRFMKKGSGPATEM